MQVIQVCLIPIQKQLVVGKLKIINCCLLSVYISIYIERNIIVFRQSILSVKCRVYLLDHYLYPYIYTQTNKPFLFRLVVILYIYIRNKTVGMLFLFYIYKEPNKTVLSIQQQYPPNTTCTIDSRLQIPYSNCDIQTKNNTTSQHKEKRSTD